VTRVVIDTGAFAAGFYLMNLDTAKTRQDTISSPGEHSHSIETASGQHEHCPVVHLWDIELAIKEAKADLRPADWE